MNTVKVRNVVIGEGMPKICVPIVGVTKEAILEEAKAITKLPADVVEWRIDWFENVFDFAALEDVMKGLREVLGDMPILMTCRTSKEGGEKAIEDEVYADINIRAAQTGYVDMVDVEVFTGDEIVKKIIDGAHAAGVKVVASNHDFFKTPDKDDIVGRLRKMQDLLCRRTRKMFLLFLLQLKRWQMSMQTVLSSRCRWQAQASSAVLQVKCSVQR